MAVEQGSADHIQSVEPPSGLVYAFRNEVCWVDTFELFFCHRVGVVHLGIRHRTTFEPAIEHFRYPLQIPFALFGRDSDVVDVFPMDILDVLHS